MGGIHRETDTETEAREAGRWSLTCYGGEVDAN